ncbi:twin-arginine translocase TatA/TatE family subunit [Agrococcus sp. SCSIO52902]|uniref:twin-arginine translocase TatA/TatE family subunit n=1 Tax=Agrococcus sp. SCSIO52902 TaxID=2933290 RepID=UPI001FF2765A|nr:twin-arginine translocase TatA/TatE family subunit [Agrococcus sp. SCSIO52902]UOW00419.1 twin-arginine translocase TatA/TatE family subunit [Agrococcus sp. SCSIO52902]
MPLGNAFNGWHLLIILIVVLLVWGSTKLPALAESLGKSAKILKKEMRSDDEARPGTPGPTGTGTPAGPATGTDRSTSAPGSDSTSDQR